MVGIGELILYKMIIRIPRNTQITIFSKFSPFSVVFPYYFYLVLELKPFCSSRVACFVRSKFKNMGIKHYVDGSSEPVINVENIYLYSMRFCPYAHRVHLILNAKSVKYEPVYINLSSKPKWYLDKFPAGKVPALLYKGEFLYESLLLADFINEEFPDNPLYSVNPVEKLKDKILIENFGKVSGAMYKLAMVEFKDEDFNALLDVLSEYEKTLFERRTQYFGDAERPLMLDYMIWPWFERLQTLEILNGAKAKIPFELFPKLVNWISLMKNDEAVKKHYLTPEQHGKHFKLRKENNPDAFDSVL